jgi:AraC-like DNA-binding protein
MTEDAARDLPGWRDLIRERFVALDIRTGDEHALRGRVGMHSVGPLSVASVASVEQVVRRTPRLIDRHGEDCLQVGFIRAGEALLEQDGRCARVAPGSFAVYDTTRPFTWTMPGPWRMDVFTWRRSDVPLDRTRIPALTARTITGGASGLVAGAALAQLAALEEPVAGTEGAQLAARVADLVLTAVAHQVPARPQAAVLLQDVLDLIELRLDDPALTPESLARACHVSLRSLHRLFADQPRSVARWIRFRRLEQARAELMAHPTRPVALIAATHGFADATSFARAFRAEFGLTPRDCRDVTHRVRAAHIGPDM